MSVRSHLDEYKGTVHKGYQRFVAHCGLWVLTQSELVTSVIV